MSRVRAYSKRLFVLGLITLFVAGSTQALHSGVGGDEGDKGEVPQAGCTCHNEAPSNSVTVLVDGLPYHYESGT